jgi:septum formation protein
MRLILASTSPRRREILSLLGVPFEVVPSGVEERSDPHRNASEEALHLAREKASAVASKHPDAVVIGSDTLIDLDGQKIGKPRDHHEALEILRKLIGREHTVATAAAVILPDTIEKSAIETVRVRMRSVPEQEIIRYAVSEEPIDKAGAYSIQGEGERLIARIDGDYLAVVGFPLRSVARCLHEAGLPLPIDPELIYRERGFLNWKRFAP